MTAEMPKAIKSQSGDYYLAIEMNPYLKEQALKRIAALQAIADGMMCVKLQTCRQNYKAVYCDCGNCVAYRSLMKLIERDEEVAASLRGRK